MEAAKVTLKAVALIAGDNNVRGALQFVQQPDGTTHVKGRITGLSPGLHGFHIHALGDTTNGCNSTGPHFNPFKKDHGARTDDERHAGDLGNVVAGLDGVADVSITDRQIPLSGVHSILGRAVVVHADPDDLGRDVSKFSLGYMRLPLTRDGPTLVPLWAGADTKYIQFARNLLRLRICCGWKRKQSFRNEESKNGFVIFLM